MSHDSPVPAQAAIHPTAIIHAGAQLHESVTVGPYAVIGPQVRIGAGSSIGAHCIIEGRTTIGADNTFHSHAAVGGAPQDKKYAGEPTELHIGDGNTVREFCTINVGTEQGGGVTRMGDDNWIMAYVHIAHDCQVGSHTIMANSVALAGHVQVGDWAIIGGLTGVHQFTRVGAHAMIGFSSHVSQDVVPFVLAGGNPFAVRGLNIEGLRRRGFSGNQLSVLKTAYRIVFREGNTVQEACDKLQDLQSRVVQGDGWEDVLAVLAFLQHAERGIAR
ncbi:acyl-ACP--UDP-N-acetylglucosamine O-acyltransferase [Corticibacter populi]|uniref:Acyl-[acyl-carrier-protein]--UDP-N-acetylglucosamine O-acyltransferase n=1 Tax=Corticibacter populi TaxID=1550736 RepID=A0A3M6QRE7_9BURK|nr:acyl-ACP--UDP-N-acetylglucosamine O-acyltransferase [Corticibacter populi]RMX05617.1 acyl-ACP--UDP-N-acetylglucosamine O-acyltransferase [Corticibacter populi]RZS31112.1 acyl-[acyl-carrier-protein]--UDP-N-acetylglucosamine O-acyltransferase [Corticibacter populi]